MLRVGIAGIGFMGWIHWLAYKQIPGVQVAAVCEQNEKRLAGDWTDIKGNFGPPGEHVDLSGLACYHELDKMLADPSLDYIDVCLPPNLHVDIVTRAATAGKHVFCEKPLALTVEECQRAVDHCRASGRLLLVGHVLPFFPEYAEARRHIDSGKYGKLLGGTFKRVISDPLWLPDFYDPRRVGGPLIDLHIHDAHFIRLLFGMPTALSSRGRRRGEVVDYCHTQFEFADPSLVVSSVMGVINQQGRPFTHGFEIHLEQATIQYEFAGFEDHGETMPLKILDRQGKVIRPKLESTDPLDGFVAEITEVANSMSSGTPSAILSGDLAVDAVRIANGQSRSVLDGQRIEIQ